MSSKTLLELRHDTVEHVRKLNNLGKTEKLEQGIDILDSWIKKQEHFVKRDYCRKYLEMQLISSKGSIEKAKMKLEKTCSIRTLIPQFFDVSDIRKEFGDILRTQCAGVPLPKLTENHCRVMPYKLYKNEIYERISFMSFYKLFFIMFEYLKIHDYCAGYIIIIDLSEMNVMDVVAKTNIIEFKQCATILLESQGMKVSSVNYVSSSKAIETLVTLVKSVLSPKIANRVHIHKNYESLHNIVPKNILPAEMEGSERSFKDLQEQWLELLAQKENMEYIKEIHRAGIDERFKKIDRIDEFANMAGSFLSLNVD